MNYDKSWTLFLDRDGVINHKLDNDYVKSWDEFEFLPGALDALAKFADVFGTIVIVTNQQGIGKGIYTASDLEEVHRRMMTEIENAGGRIDKIYYCPGLAKDDPPCRKPNPGMALDAKKDFPSIDFERSVMVGDSVSDMEMGRAVGMRTVFIASEVKMSPLIDHCFTGLKEFADSIRS
jgi:histidinol-phosphate phosphatase family protein